MSATDTSPATVTPASLDPRRRRRILAALFTASLLLSLAVFTGFDYFYSRTMLGSVVSGGPHGFCFSRDPVRAFAFQPDCSCVRPWLGAAYTFNTNSLGFRDQQVREVASTGQRPRILILGDSAPEGMTEWHDSFIGRVADHFPQYDFLNGSVEGYSPSNYLNTARMLTRDGIDFDEVIVFLDISDLQDEAAFFHDKDASGAVAIARGKVSKSSTYSDLRLWINNNLLLTNDVFQFVEKTLVGFGWYHLDLGHGGNEFDLERSAWTYRAVSDRDPYELGYAPLGVEGGIAREKAKMDTLWLELKEKNIPMSVVVTPWPAQLAHDQVDSRQVRIWRDWCDGKCQRFISLFPAFFAIKQACPSTRPGCWYLNDFIFGDTHYNSAGDALVAATLIDNLTRIPAKKRDPGEIVPAVQASGRAHTQERP